MSEENLILPVHAAGGVVSRALVAASFAAALLVVFSAGPVLAQAEVEKPPAEAEIAKPPATAEELEKQRVEVLNTLLERLSRSENEQNAKLLEKAVWQMWLRSGSQTIDLLMQQAVMAMNDDDMNAALAIFDAMVELAPGFAEGWNKRATVYFVLQRYDASLRDIKKVLELEPRHFGALSGRALIMRRKGDDRAALEAYRKAIEVHPFLDGVPQAIRELEAKVEGKGI